MDRSGYRSDVGSRVDHEHGEIRFAQRDGLSQKSGRTIGGAHEAEEVWRWLTCKFSSSAPGRPVSFSPSGLSRLGVRVRIIDKTSEPGTTSRALVVHARTLEFYRQLGLAEAVVEKGLKFAAANLWARGRKAGRVALWRHGRRSEPFPLPSHISAGRARATSHRAAERNGDRGRAPNRTPRLRGRRRAGVGAAAAPRRVRGNLRSANISRAATAPIRRSAKRSVPAFRAAPTRIFSTSRTWRQAGP